MSAAKKIEISKSSLVSLKAELARKQEEVSNAKATAGSAFIHPLPRPKKETIFTKKNRGVDQREEKDAEEIKEEEDAHKKSRAALEAKSKLYDSLNQGSTSTDENGDSRFLVDFQRKAAEEVNTSSAPDPSSDVEEQLDSDEYNESTVDPEDDWVDYIDCLGRTRRCLRRDLEFVKSKDAQLAKSLHILPDMDGSKPIGEQDAVNATDLTEPELISGDMRREQLRQKWEKQEELLRDKRDIHYQDVLFDEARAHGVGYFAFSQQEAERSAQQQALEKQRQETQRQQQLAREVRQRREKQLQARLKAARARNRARLGLPPEEDEPEPPAEEQTATAPPAEEKAAPAADVPVEAPRKPQTVRPWDIGKEGTATTRRPFEPMSQEDWVKKKRDERPKEFAPIYEEDRHPSTSVTPNVAPNFAPPPKRIKIHNELLDDYTRGLGIEIGPPPPHVYMTAPSAPPRTSGNIFKGEIERSIEAGLAKLRQEHEERRRRGDEMPVDLM